MLVAEVSLRVSPPQALGGGRLPFSRASRRQAYVKRVVGLPGESIRINGGDIFVNGRIVRKSLAEIRAMRILVHDSRFQPQDADRFPRWQFRSGSRDRPAAKAAGAADGGQFVHAAVAAQAPRPTTGWSTSTGTRRGGGYGPIRDFYGYNGGELRS